jgi:uroporphyrinogen-III decarboxylase
MRLDDGRAFATDEMTSRQRLLAAYRRQPVDRIPYWAKVANDNWRRGQGEPVRSWTDRELLDYIHADGLFSSPRCVKAEAPHARGERIDDGRGGWALVTHTPEGDLVERWAYDAATGTHHPVEYPVKTLEDLKRYRWAYTGRKVIVDAAAVERSRQRRDEVGERGMTLSGWGTSPLMQLIEHVLGQEQTMYFLADYPDEMAELIGLMHASNRELVRQAAETASCDAIVSVENTSTTLLSPQLFERWCRPHLCDYGRIIESAGKMHELHMCGLLGALLERIDGIPAASMEAFTCPPLGNTRLADGRTRVPSKTLIGGTCANVWWRRTAEQIEEFVAGELAACPDHRGIVLTTAGVAPQACGAETFRAVGQWLAGVRVKT